MKGRGILLDSGSLLVFNSAAVYYPVVGELLHNRYKLVQVLSSGAFGQLYLAEDTLDPTRSRWAIKYYLSTPHYPHLRQTSRQLYWTEAGYLKRLGIHPQIPTLHDYFEENQSFYLVQEYIEGVTLTEEFSLSRYNSPLERVAQVVYLLWDIMQVLNFVHANGIIHCDLKPNNFIRRQRDGRIVLLDFGAAQPNPVQPGKRSQFRLAQPSRAINPLDSAGYLAPEQLTGQIYPSSDLYAAGILALQFLTGRNVHQLSVDAQTGDVNPPDWTATDTPKPDFFSALRALLGKLVRYHHYNRFQMASEVLQALEPMRMAVHHTLVQQWGAVPLPEPIAPELLTSEEYITAAAIRADERLALPAVEQEALVEASLAESASALMLTETRGNESSPSEPLPPGEDGLAETKLIPQAQVVPLLQYQWHQPGWQFLARMGLVVGALNAFALSLGVYHLRAVTAQDPGRDLWQAARAALQTGQYAAAVELVGQIPPESSYYDESQQALAQWQTDWQIARSHLTAIQSAFARQDWQEVIRSADRLPAIAYWQQQAKPYVTKARPQAERQAKMLVGYAFAAAQNRDFTQALAYLYQIAPQTQVGQQIAPKLEEYQRKQSVRAMRQLQNAYDLATQYQFNDAIAVLQTIPPNTTAGAIAQAKMAEYQEKAQLRSQILTQRG